MKISIEFIKNGQNYGQSLEIDDKEFLENEVETNKKINTLIHFAKLSLERN